ncbi:MAG: hypothetical protein IGS54_14720 [Elainella sp. C42_A2020_010]|nr:hypothetical protein [Elainella sp. C42_A2020_010]
MNLSLYGLLHLAENQTGSMDDYAKTYEQKKIFYLISAVNLSRSLRKRGITFTLLTNRKEEIYNDLKSLSYNSFLAVEELDFNIHVPNGIYYYSAHFKLDVFRHLASLQNEAYVGLVDIDMIAINDIPSSFKNLVREKIPVCYDVSDQLIPAFGHDVILQDMQKLSPDICEGRWYGGEFIMGPPEFFASLNAEIEPIYTRYVEIADELFHKGDEMLTSVALEKLRRSGTYIADAGTLGIVGRFFSVPTIRHPQKSFKYFESCFLLHLPVDKDFLAKLTPEQAECRESFLKRYKSYLSIIWFTRGFKKLRKHFILLVKSSLLRKL